MRRPFGLLAFVPLLGGCYVNDVVLDRARMESDVPVTPPAMVPDSVNPGSAHVQLGLWSMDTDDSVAARRSWSRSPLGLQGQLQVVVGPHLRWAFGAGYSRTASAWVGPVVSVRNSLLRWDLELLTGITHHRTRLEGHVRYEEDGLTVKRDSLTGMDGGSGVWGQWTLRCRAARSGPWLEGRVIPSFTWGELGSPTGESEPARVRSTLGVLGVGWAQEARGGGLWLAGVRAVGIEDRVFPQFLFSVQRPVGRGRD